MNVYPNQVKAGDEVVDLYSVGSVQHVILKADVQSGKTGCYLYIAKKMLELGRIRQCYLICGSNATDLRDQSIKDVQKAFPNQSCVRVLYRQDFTRVALRAKDMTDVLIINDESHLDCEKNQMLDRFLSTLGLDMAGTSEYMIRNNIYILSVSATPFAEQSAMVYEYSRPKEMVFLEPGEGYFGPFEYHQRGLIHPAFPLKTAERRSEFISLVKRTSSKRYVLLRGGEKRSPGLSILQAELMQEGIRVLHYTSTYDKHRAEIAITAEEAAAHFKTWGKSIPSLEDEPSETTVIILDGRLRCGKRVPKQWIGMVWEMGATKNTDVVIQGLLGRMSGYDVPEHLPLIFVSEEVLKTRKGKVVEESDLLRYLIATRAPRMRNLAEEDTRKQIAPRCATHLLPDVMSSNKVRGDGEKRYPCVPIKISVPRVASLYPSDEQGIKTHCLAALKHAHDADEQLLREHMTEDQYDEVWTTLESIEANECHLRRYMRTASGVMTNAGMFTSQMRAIKSGEIATDGISDGHVLTFCVVLDGFVSNHDEYPAVAGDVIVIFNTRALHSLEIIPLSARISKEDGLTHFTRRTPQVLVEEEKKEVGFGVFSITSDIETSESEFERQLGHFIELQQKNKIGHMDNQIRAANNSFMRLVWCPHAIATSSTYRKVCERLEERYRVAIRTEFGMSLSGVSGPRIIQWTAAK